MTTNVDDLANIRRGAEMRNMKPYLDHEVEALKKAVVNSVLAAVNNGNLTPEMALSKWMEYVAYMKLTQKFNQRIAVGQSVGTNTGNSLDFPAPLV